MGGRLVIAAASLAEALHQTENRPSSTAARVRATIGVPMVAFGVWGDAFTCRYSRDPHHLSPIERDRTHHVLGLGVPVRLLSLRQPDSAGVGPRCCAQGCRRSLEPAQAGAVELAAS